MRRRTLLSGTAAAIAAPYGFVKNITQAWGAQSWLQKGKPIKVGLLFSLTGGLAVPEEEVWRWEAGIDENETERQ